MGSVLATKSTRGTRSISGESIDTDSNTRPPAPTPKKKARFRHVWVGRSNMKETIIDTKVTYSLLLGGKVYIVENVPARVCKETGEQYFSPETVEHLQAIIKGGRKPVRVVEAPVFEYA